MIGNSESIVGASQMEEEFRHRVIEALRRGESLPPEWARALFPPERREYELVYHGKEREEDILANTMGVPLQPVRTFGKNGDTHQNMLVFGDNLQGMKTLLRMKENGQLLNADGTPGVRLIYIDPPFATKQEFRGSQDQKAYQDRVAGARFVEFLRKRLVFLRELLSDDGTLYVHLDWKKVHYAKIVLDEVFGENRFRNNIAWHYYNRLPSGGNVFESKHDSILVYTKSSAWIFKPQYEKRDKMALKKKQVKVGGKSMNARDENGNIIYLELETRKVDDVWRLPLLVRTAEEYTGYPTQKTEALLERIIDTASKPGDLVLDCFAGSGTACAVAEKMGRRWIGIDCGKLAIYTIQKRMLNLKQSIGNKGKLLNPKPFTLYNAGLYDFSRLRQLPWQGWRFFALQLFGCKDEPHTIGGLDLDGKLKGASVLVFNHLEQSGRKIDEDTILGIHSAIGNRIGRKFFIIAPRGVFDFQQDYIDIDSVRYYALRIPYSIINELHQREFTALQQPYDETSVNETVDAVGFDFIQPPKVTWTLSVGKREGQLIPEARLRIQKFQTTARLRGRETKGDLETLSMVMVDLDYNGDVFDMGAVFYAQQLSDNDWSAWLPVDDLGENLMVVFIDIYGNEAREVINAAAVVNGTRTPKPKNYGKGKRKRKK
jgi:site-specific DNA-methyltransferase (adenine-specific)/adenine-specific DNA-methyltransferase